MEVIGISSVSYLCYYHPANISEIDCEKCNKHICVLDKRLYRKKQGFGRDVYYTNHTYCVYCLDSQLRHDFCRQIKNLIIIPLLMIFLLILYLIFPDTLYVGSKNMSILAFVFIGLPLVVIIGPLIAYLRIYRAKKDVYFY